MDINNLPIYDKKNLNAFILYEFGNESNKDLVKSYNISSKNYFSLSTIERVKEIDENVLKYECVYGTCYFVKNKRLKSKE